MATVSDLATGQYMISYTAPTAQEYTVHVELTHGNCLRPAFVLCLTCTQLIQTDPFKA